MAKVRHFTTQDLMERWSASRNTVNEYRHRYGLKAIKMGNKLLFRQSDVERLESQLLS